MRHYVIGYESTYYSLQQLWNEWGECLGWDGCSSLHVPTVFRSYSKARKIADARGWQVRTVGPRLLSQCSDRQQELISRATKATTAMTKQRQLLTLAHRARRHGQEIVDWTAR